LAVPGFSGLGVQNPAIGGQAEAMLGPKLAAAVLLALPVVLADESSRWPSANPT